MKILIAYASKTDTAKNCAHYLQSLLEGVQSDIADLEQAFPDPAEYDAVILGSSVRFGRIRPVMKRFLKQYEKALGEIPHGLFLCCGFGHTFDEYAERQFSARLRDTAFAVMNFGGLLKLEKASVWERFFLYRVRCMIRETEIDDMEYTPTLPGILPENISRMASALRNQLAMKKQV